MSRVRVPFPAPKNWATKHAADVAQSVERVLGKDEVTSSSLVIGSTQLFFDLFSVLEVHSPQSTVYIYLTLGDR